MKRPKVPPRVLLAGVGRWGTNHLRVWQTLGADLYVAEPSEAQRHFCRRAGVPDDHLVADVAAALDRVDLVDVVTPVDSHYPIARAALEAGKDLFIEKPLTSTSHEGMALDRRARELGRILQVGHIFRYDTATDFLRETIGRGDLGQVRWLQGRFTGFKRPRADCGVTAADALHFIDLFNFLLGQAPDTVTARFADLLGRGMEDMSWVVLHYGAAVGVVEANYFAPEKERRVMIVGDAATLLCDFAPSQDRIRIYRNRHAEEGGTWKAVEGTVTLQEVSPEEPLFRELRGFVHACETRQPPLADGRAGYEVIQIIEAAQRSSETGQAISLGQRTADAYRSPVEGIHLRRDQAESPPGHRLRTIHPRPELRGL